METLLVVEHKNQYYSRGKPGRVGPSPSNSFLGINCRTFQSGTGILPTPPPLRCSSTSTTTTTTTVSKKPCLCVFSPKTLVAKSESYSDSKAVSRNNGRTNSIPINARSLKKEKPVNEGLLFSELWAGPAYSNSPPPSSVPIPKFSVRPKRTVSLELPSSVYAIEMHPMSKSTPRPQPESIAPLNQISFIMLTQPLGLCVASSTLMLMMNEWQQGALGSCK